MRTTPVHLSEFQDLLSQLRDGNNHSACCRAVAILNTRLNAPSKSALSQLRGLKRVAPDVKTVDHTLSLEDEKKLAECLDELEKECSSTRATGEVELIKTNAGEATGIDMNDVFSLITLIVKLFQGFRGSRESGLTRQTPEQVDKVSGQKLTEKLTPLPPGPGDGDFERNPNDQTPKHATGNVKSGEATKVENPNARNKTTHK